MPDESFHGSRRRERVGPNLYKRHTRDGRVRYDAVFRDADGHHRTVGLAAASRRSAERELRTVLSKRDQGDRVVGSKLTLRGFVEREYLPLLDSLAAAGRRSERGVDGDRTRWEKHLDPQLGGFPLAKVEGRRRRPRRRNAQERLLRGDDRARHRRAAKHLPARPLTGSSSSRSPVDELDAAEKPTAAQGRRSAVCSTRLELDSLVRHAPKQTRSDRDRTRILGAAAIGGPWPFAGAMLISSLASLT